MKVCRVVDTIESYDTWPLDDLIDSAIDNSAVTWNTVNK